MTNWATGDFAGARMGRAVGVPVGGVDVARHQHMTTFTLGLGVSGYMLFDESYRTATSGDFFDIPPGHDGYVDGPHRVELILFAASDHAH